MKPVSHLLLGLAILLIASRPLSAQTFMRIHLSDGTLMSAPVADIDSVTWDAGDNDLVNNHRAVDLGLSVRWADMNIGAYEPEEFGWYFAWGEPTSKNMFNGKNYTRSNKYTVQDGKTVLEPADDAATVNWEEPWRMPTYDEIHELVVKCTWTWVRRQSVYGYQVTGPSGNSIFLPAAGYVFGITTYMNGDEGRYWSSSLHSTNSGTSGWYLYFDIGAHKTMDYSRVYGFSIRPVTE